MLRVSARAEVRRILETNSGYWKSLIKIGYDTPTPTGMTPGTHETVPQNRFVLNIQGITFPTPLNLNINMMPFIIDF